MSDLISRLAAINALESKTYRHTYLDQIVGIIKDLPSEQPEDYTELKREFLRMASYIDVLLECSDEQKETLIGFISRLAEFMPWDREGLSMSDLISRQAVNGIIDALFQNKNNTLVASPSVWHAFREIQNLPYAQPEQRWIPCSSGNLPQTTDPVNITWVNRDPPSYYSFIKDIPFTATGHYHNGKWWWYSAACKDYLDEYGESEVDRVDDRIEILAWQPLPDPYWEEKS